MSDVSVAETTTDETDTSDLSPLAQLEAINQRVLSDDEVEKVVGSIMENCAETDIPLHFTFDADADFPETHQMCVIPVKEQHKKGTKDANGNPLVGRYLVRMIVGAIPRYNAVVALENGQTFIQNVLEEQFCNTLKKAVVLSVEDNRATPFEVADFLETGRGTGVWKTFSEVGPIYVGALKKLDKGLKVLTLPLLRQVLSVRSVAEHMFPATDQAVWEEILRRMIETAKEMKLDPSVIVNMLNTRNDAAEKTVAVDLEKLQISVPS